MKENLQRISDVCKLIFGYGIDAICTFIYKSFIPLIIKASTILILFGLLAMYLAGEKALAPDKHSVKKIVKE